MGQVREGKTAKDKRRGHRAGVKNTKPQGERGHLFGSSRYAWRKKISRKAKGKA